MNIIGMMQLNRVTVASLALAAAPVLLMVALPMIRQVRGPATAQASLQIAVQSPVTQLARTEPTEGQLAAIEYLSTQRQESASQRDRSPFLHVTFVEGEPFVPELAAGVPTYPIAVVSAIMSGPRSMAVVNGQPLMVGQVFEQDWRVESIDTRGAVVEFVHRLDGDIRFAAQLEMTLPRP
jgi:hypothetical protein